MLGFSTVKMTTKYKDVIKLHIIENRFTLHLSHI